MDISAVIDRFRNLEADGLTDSCEIREPTSQTFTEGTATYAATPGALIYSGPCRFKPEGTAEEQGGEREVTIRRGVLIVPHTVAAAAVNQRVTLTATKDGQLDGTLFKVTGVITETWLVTRHLEVEAITEESDREVTDA